MATEKNSEGEKGGAHTHTCSCLLCKDFGVGCNMHWMHWALRLAIILFVFWAGIEFGKLEAFVQENGGGYGYHSQMRGYYGGYDNGQYAQPMMVQYRAVPATDSAAPAASTTPRR